MAREIEDNDVQQADSTTDATDQTEAATEPTASDESTSGESEGTTPAAPAVDVEALTKAFEDAVVESLNDEGRDEDTGAMPEAAFQPVREAFSALPSRAKTASRDWLQGKITAAMIGDGDTEADYLAARSFLEIMNALKTSAPRQTVTKAPVDPTEAHVARIVSLMLSPNLVPVPAGVSGDWQSRVSAMAAELGPQVIAYRDWQAANLEKPTDEQTPAPEVNEVVLAAVQAAKGRSVAVRKTSSSGPKAPRAASSAASGGPRRNIATHILNAFADKGVGTFLTIAEIVKTKSDEYGDEEPSQGAVAARLFPGGDPGKCNVPGIRAEQRDRKGAVKL